MKRLSRIAFCFVLALAFPALATQTTEHKEAHHGKSADELAKELTNPNNSIAKLTFKNQYR